MAIVDPVKDICSWRCEWKLLAFFSSFAIFLHMLMPMDLVNGHLCLTGFFATAFAALRTVSFRFRERGDDYKTLENIGYDEFITLKAWIRNEQVIGSTPIIGSICRYGGKCPERTQ